MRETPQSTPNRLLLRGTGVLYDGRCFCILRFASAQIGSSDVQLERRINDRLKNAHDSTSDFFQIVLVKARGHQQKRLEQRPSKDKRAERADHDAAFERDG